MSLSRDVRQTLRSLMRLPAFASLAISTLTVGIGVTVAMFTIFNAVLLRPLPYARSGELIRIRGDAAGLGLKNISVSIPEFIRYRRDARVFRDVGAFTTGTATLVDDQATIPLSAIYATPTLVDVIGAQPVIGRRFTAAEEQEGAAPVVLISAELWKSRYGADRSIIGRSVMFGTRQYTVVGVLPEGLKFPPGLTATVADVWFPRVFTAAERESWGDRSLGVIARLRPGQTLASARADLARVATSIAAERADVYPSRLGWKPVAETVPAEVVGTVRPMLFVMMGAVALVLMIACANVANLLLARATARRREVAVRMAIGARRGQIIRQFLVESLTLSAIGGVLGVVLAWLAVRALVAIGSGPLPWLSDAAIDWRVVAFTMAAVLTTGLTFGAAPARFAGDVSLNETLKAGGWGSTASRAHQRARATLIAGETMLAVVLLAGAALLARSFAEVMRVRPGFDPDNVVTMRITAPESRFRDSIAARAMYREVFRRVSELNGVQAVSAAHILPLTGDNNDWGFLIEGRPVGPNSPPGDEQVRIVAPGYFATMRIPVLRGRGIDRSDESNAPPVVVVNEAMAAKLWPSESAIGKRISFDGGMQTPNWRTVVGIVGNVRHDALDMPPKPEFYVPVLQSPRSFRELHMVVRETVDPATLLPELRRVVADVDPKQPTRTLVPLSRILSDSIATRRFLMLVLVIFAAVAFSLAAVGIYGLTMIVVQQRTNELGIRIALGARSAEIIRLVVGQGARIVGAGVAAGIVVSLVTGRLIRSQLYGVTASDPLTLAAVALALCGAALLACYLPARRAARIDPLKSLRAD